MSVIYIWRPADSDEEPVYRPGFGTYDPNDPSNKTAYADLPPVPVEWIIVPLNRTAAQCPSREATIRTFAFTNAVVALFAIVFGCRPLLHKLTRGVLGKRGGNSIKYMWIVSLAVQLLANLSVSLLIRRTPGYEPLSLLNIFALYSARLRVSLISLALLRIFVGVNLRRLTKSMKYIEEFEFVYADSYISSVLTELCMEMFAAIFIGVTWNRFPNQLIKKYMSVWYTATEGLPGATFFGIAFFVPFYHRGGEAIPQEYTDTRGRIIRSYKNVRAHRSDWLPPVFYLVHSAL